MENLWILWIVVGIALAVAEAFTLGFVLLWFGIGALVAAAVAVAGGGFVVQVLAFLFVSAVLTVLSRTIFEQVFFRDKGAKIKMGMASLPGQVATVVESSHGALGEGAVKVFGSTWTAYPVDGEEPLEQGESVTVERVEGAVLYVKRKRLTEGSWRST